MPLGSDAGAAVVDVVIPVYNEAAEVESSVRRVHAFLAERFLFPTRITVADNGSVDGTAEIAERLAAELPGVRVLRRGAKGRGGALAQAWLSSDAPVLAYMDVDLSTDLSALAPLIAPLISGHSDVAIGTRLAGGSRVVRSARRETISRGYMLLLKSALAVCFSDAQCGFKAIRADVARELLPHIVDTGWFFDTELLVLAQRAGLRIHEVPVDWVDSPDSRVNILGTAATDVRGVARLLGGFATGTIPVRAIAEQLGSRTAEPPGSLLRQAVRFAAIGVLSTLAYVALFTALRHHGGAQLANLLALLITALANTAANRRFTFAVRGGARLARHHGEGLLVFGVALAMTSTALAVLHRVGVADRAVEIGVLMAANLLATVTRFVLLRGWVFHPRRDGGRA